MGKINDINESWEGHLFEEIEEFVKSELQSKSDSDDNYSEAEEARESAEKSREEAEELRKNEEQKRIDAEGYVEYNEITGDLEGNGRQLAEHYRNEAERLRNEAEGSWIVDDENYGGRQKNEHDRLVAEGSADQNSPFYGGRQLAEAKREEAEELRNKQEGASTDEADPNGSRWAKYNNFEQERQVSFESQAEEFTNRFNSQAEQLEQLYSDAEGQVTDEAGEGSRWAKFYKNEAERDEKVENVISNLDVDAKINAAVENLDLTDIVNNAIDTIDVSDRVKSEFNSEEFNTAVKSNFDSEEFDNIVKSNFDEAFTEQLTTTLNSNDFKTAVKDTFSSDEFNSAVKYNFDSTEFSDAVKEQFDSNEFTTAVKDTFGSTEFDNYVKYNFDSDEFNSAVTDIFSSAEFDSAVKGTFSSNEFDDAVRSKFNDIDITDAVKEQFDSTEFSDTVKSTFNSDEFNSAVKDTFDSDEFVTAVKDTFDSDELNAVINIAVDDAIENLDLTDDVKDAIKELDIAYLEKTDLEINIDESEFDENTKHNEIVKSVAHRGYASIAPENTMPAFTLACQKGYKYIETDVRITKDGKFVLVHDADISHTSNANSGTYVNQLTLEQLRQYDFSFDRDSSTRRSGYQNVQIPTLEEFLILCRTNKVHPYIELKVNDQNNVELWNNDNVKEIIDVIKSYLGNNFTITAFELGGNESTSTVFNCLKKVVAYDKNVRVGHICNGSSTSTSIQYAKALQTGTNEVFIEDMKSSQANANACKSNSIGYERWAVKSDSEITDYIYGYINDYANGTYYPELTIGLNDKQYVTYKASYITSANEDGTYDRIIPITSSDAVITPDGNNITTYIDNKITNSGNQSEWFVVQDGMLCQIINN